MTNTLIKTPHYRLKQVDYNGDKSYTRTISVQMNSKIFESDLIIYPNPSNDIITIFHPKLAAEVIIYSITGQVLIKKLIESNSETLDISKFASGLYIVGTNVGKLKFSKR